MFEPQIETVETQTTHDELPAALQAVLEEDGRADRGSGFCSFV